VENTKCILVITVNFQPSSNTLDSNCSFKVGKERGLGTIQSIHAVSDPALQTVSRAMENWSPSTSRSSWRPAKLLTDSQCGLTPNSSKGLIASENVRRTPCPKGMSQGDFVEVSLSSCVLIDKKVHPHTNCRVKNTRAHTHRYKRRGPYWALCTANNSPRNTQTVK